MKNAKLYKEKLSNADDPRYTFEHYNGVSFYPSYNMTTDDLRELRNEYKKDSKITATEKLTDRAIIMHSIHNNHTLKSYYTKVAMITDDNRFLKLWDGFTVTTLKHINLFREKYNLPPISKYEWIMMERI